MLASILAAIAVAASPSTAYTIALPGESMAQADSARQCQTVAMTAVCTDGYSHHMW